MGSIVGDVVTAILIVADVTWDKKHGTFRGFWLQILGALCVGWVLNSSAPSARWALRCGLQGLV